MLKSMGRGIGMARTTIRGRKRGFVRLGKADSKGGEASFNWSYFWLEGLRIVSDNQLLGLSEEPKRSIAYDYF